MTQQEYKYRATLKAGKDFDAPWLTIGSDDAGELEMLLQTLERNTTFATLGRLAANFAGQFNLGKGLGATNTAAPVSEPAYNGGTMAQAAPAAPVQQYAQPAAPAAAAAPAGVPMVLGIPAKWIDKGSWKAWADPRGQAETGPEKLKTDDPNHPGLAAGTHKFWRFVR